MRTGKPQQHRGTAALTTTVSSPSRDNCDCSQHQERHMPDMTSAKDLDLTVSHCVPI